MHKYAVLRVLTDKRFKVLTILTVLFLMNLGIVFAQGTEVDVGDVKKRIACMICRVMNIFFYIAGGIAALIIVIAGIRWVGSGEDPGARAASKSSIISAIVGLIIIVMAVYLVTWLLSSFGIMDDVVITDWITDCTNVCPEEI